MTACTRHGGFHRAGERSSTTLRRLLLSRELLAYHASQRADLCRRQIALLILRVHLRQLAQVVIDGAIIDRTNAAALPAPLSAPAQLPQAGTAWYERPLLWAQTQRGLHRAILLIIKVPSETGGEDWRLNEAHAELRAIGVVGASHRGECQNSCRMNFHPLTTSAVAERASLRYTVVVVGIAPHGARRPHRTQGARARRRAPRRPARGAGEVSARAAMLDE